MGKTKKPTEGTKPVEQAIPEMTSAEREEALELLRSPELLTQFLDDMERVGCVGEEENKLMVGLTLTSRLGNDPIGLIVKGESSAGKSHIVKTAAKFFPPEEVINITALSGKALYHMDQDLSHKALIICERPGAEASDYPIRALLSEKELRLMTAVTGKNRSDWKTVTKVVKGPVAYIETTTKTQLDPENENRCFELSPDESQEQTRRIQDYQRQFADCLPVDPEPIYKRWQNAQRLLDRLTVTIPFGALIRFPSDAVRSRRDFPRFLSLIRASALFHQRQRETTIIQGRSVLLASTKDYAVAYDLAQAVLGQTMSGLSPAARVVLDEVEKVVQETNLISREDPTIYQTFTAQDIVDHSSLTLRTVQRYLPVCAKGGYLETVEAKRGCLYRYRFVRSSGIPETGLLSPESLEIAFRQQTETEPTVPEVRQSILVEQTIETTMV